MATPSQGGSSHSGSGGSDAHASRAADEWMSLAQLARTAFRGHNYQSSLEHLQRMAKQRPDDLKVHHNILIAQYHQGGNGDPAKLLDQLVKLKQRMDESATRGDEEGALVVELSSALIRYNQALLSFSVKHHADALAILEPLFRNIDPLEFVAVKVTFLLMEVYIATRQADKALQVISFIEKTYLRPPSPPAPLSTEQVPTLLGQTADEEAGADSALGIGLPHMAPRPVGPPPSITSVGELKASLHISRARVHVLLRAFPAAKRELKQATALVAPSSPLLVGCMFLKAHVEYALANYRKAVKLLNVIHHPSSSPADAASLSAPDRALRALYYADMGAIHFRLKKYRAAAHYLSTALKEQPAGKVTPFAKREELLYNLGLCYLQLREGDLAFVCLHESLYGLARTPRRCVRLAEAAVLAHASRTRDTIFVEVQQNFSPSVRRVAVIAPLQLDDNSHVDAMLESWVLMDIVLRSNFVTYFITAISLLIFAPQEAVRYLTVALLLISSPRPPTPTSTPTSAATFAAASAVTTSNPKDVADLPHIKITALALLAYAHLALHNPVSALSSALSLLALADVSSTFSFLAHLYAAEALCTLNRIPEALVHLAPSLIDGHYNNVEAAPIRVQFYTSLAVVHTLEDDLDKAATCINSALALLQSQPPAQLLLLLVYVDLRRGNTEEAISTLRRARCRVTVRVPHRPPLKSEKPEKR